MVLFTMTSAIVAATRIYTDAQRDRERELPDHEASLKAPAVGNPITHTQIVTISRYLRKISDVADDPTTTYHLDDLLRGSTIYIEPPKPRPQQTTEYKALMERLRRDEVERSYERMINPPPQLETFSQRFPHASGARLFPDGLQTRDTDDDEITYADVNRQMALIMNILISIIACSAAIWMASSSWSTPKRLGLSMGGSGIIGVAEIVVYAGYLRRLTDAKEKGKKEVEVKEIIQTWVIGGNNTLEPKASTAPSMDKDANSALRKRKGGIKS